MCPGYQPVVLVIHTEGEDRHRQSLWPASQAKGPQPLWAALAQVFLSSLFREAETTGREISPLYLTKRRVFTGDKILNYSDSQAGDYTWRKTTTKKGTRTRTRPRRKLSEIEMDP